MVDEGPQTVRQAIGSGFREGTKQRMTNYVGGSGGSSNTNYSSGGGHYGFVVIVALFFVLVLFGGPLYAECEGSGFCETRIKEPIIEPVVEAVKNTFGFVGRQTQQTRAIISGEQTFSWTSDVESRERTGIWFDNKRTYGITLGETEEGVLSILGSEFGAIVDIVVGKMDENVDKIIGNLDCSLGNQTGQQRGLLAISNTNVTLFPPSEGEKTSVHGPFECVFTNEQAKKIIKTVQGKPYFSEDIIFNLSYSLSPTISLPVFAIKDEEIYNSYKGQLGDAFEELAEASYKEYSRGVNSKIEYDTDVQAILQLISQPISPKGEALIGVQFRNKNLKNIARIDKFNFTLPLGLSIVSGAKIGAEKDGTCDWFVGNGNYYEFNLNNGDVIRDLRDLNRGTGDTRPFLCKLNVDESVLRDNDLQKVGDIEGTLTYSYTISEIVKISN